MRNFRRALWLALRRNKFTFVCATICSILVGVFWGISIGALYPFLEVIFQGDSLHGWVDSQIAKSKTHIEQLETQIGALQTKQQQLPGSERRAVTNELDRIQGRLTAERQALWYSESAQPYIYYVFPRNAFQTLVLLVVLSMMGSLLRNLSQAGNTILVERISQRTALDIRQRCFAQTLQMDLQSFQNNHTGGLMTHYVTSMNMLREGIKALFGLGFREPLRILACLLGAAFISWRLLFLSLLLIPVAVLCIALLGKAIKATNTRMMQQMTHLYKRLAESFSLIYLIKAFTLETHERDRFDKSAKHVYRQAQRVIWFVTFTRFTADLIWMGVISLGIVMGAYLVLNRETHLFGMLITSRPLTPSALMVFYAFLLGLRDPTRKLTEVFTTVQRATTAAEQIFPLIDQTPAIAAPPNPKPVPDKPCTLTFDHIHFSYRAGQPVLNDVSLQIQRGETVALVGPSGCGKTTLTHLLMRLYDVDNGAVRCDGIDVRHFDPEAFRQKIGLVTQQSLLFHDTIRDNIRLGKLDATDDEITAAAQKAHAHGFIQQFELGYDNIVGERGGCLSGGQRQRLALARAILRDPDILILDEATNQIDGESEQLIQRALGDFIRDRITLLITHRLSTLTLADRIVVMDEGILVDCGTHDELTRRCALYQRLYGNTLKKTA